MARYKLSNNEKKNVTEVEIWRNSDTDQSFTIESGWRWGEWFFESDTEPNIDLVNEKGIDPFSIADIDDHSYDDGCWLFFEFPDDFDQGLAEQIETAYEEDSFSGLNNLGFEHWDTETIVSGPLLLEKVED